MTPTRHRTLWERLDIDSGVEALRIGLLLLLLMLFDVVIIIIFNHLASDLFPANTKDDKFEYCVFNKQTNFTTANFE